MIINFNIKSNGKITFNSTKKEKINVKVYTINKSDKRKIYSTILSTVPNVGYFIITAIGWLDRIFEFYNEKNELIYSETVKVLLENKKFGTIIPKKELLHTELCDLMIECGSDKATTHNYSSFYYKKFNKFIDKKINIFELGLGSTNENIPYNMTKNGVPCASLYAMEKFFKKSEIYGADIDTSILKHEKFNLFYCDVTDIFIIDQMWDNYKLYDKLFDIIIDDGLHEFDSNIRFLDHSLHKLNKGGIYIVEDITCFNLKKWYEILGYLKTNYYNYDFELLILESDTNHSDNNLLCVEKK